MARSLNYRLIQFEEIVISNNSTIQGLSTVPGAKRKLYQSKCHPPNIMNTLSLAKNTSFDIITACCQNKRFKM